uniref:non-specific serine/threonine protein kinase n=1 Tax=Oryza sativa subsp. japonica TaxID=39947 RepID=Q2QW13_ORYSJ|nr:Leucine Rich Repeat family protein, expressed [Oryza sativa Japonica Group]
MSSFSKRVAHHLTSLLTVMHILLQVQATPTLADRTTTSIVTTPVLCLPEQASALLQLKGSFNVTAGDYSTVFRSWVAGADCCHWEGVHCDGADGRVTSLDLGGHHLQADSVHPALFRLTSLKHLDLSGNNFSMSKLPFTGFQELTELMHLDLSNTNIAGEVPAGIGSIMNLVYLDLSTKFYALVYDDENNIMKFTLDSFWQLKAPNMETFLTNLTNLEQLHMGMMDMSREGERWCDHIAKSTPKLQVLSLPWCSLSGPICASLSAMQSLNTIELHRNHLSGSIPEFFASFSNLSVLQLSKNDFQGWFPPIIFQHKKLRMIDLSKNPGISGNLPNFSQESSLENLFVSSTNFTGSLKYLDLLEVSGLQLVGSIPSWISNLTSLTALQFSNCGLSGQVPSSIGNLRKLTKLALYNCNFSGKENKLIGTLPDNIKEGCALEAIDISGNLFEGKIPRSLIACRNLEILDIGGNHFSDSFPCWMSQLPKLQVLVLKSNKFTGQLMDPSYMVGGNTCEFTELRIADMASNDFNGTLPEAWFKMLKSMMTRSDNETLVMENQYYHGQTYQFTATVTYKGNYMTISKILRTLVLIDFSNNAFHGAIPETIGELILLHGLNMSHNALTGSIPTQFGRLNQLESLDLSSNEFSGEIPEELASLNFLSTLNLSYNMLVGRIPNSYQFSTFSNNSFLGNTGLCGPPLSRQCNNPKEPIAMPYTLEKSIDVVLLLFTASGFFISFAMMILIVWGSQMRKQH